jgi:hypothetical protein
MGVAGQMPMTRSFLRRSIRTLLLGCVVAVGLGLAQAQASTEVEAEHDAAHELDDHEEANPEFETFLKAGYEMLSWQFDDSQREMVFKNILLPDWRGRSKESEPKYPSFDYALQNLTGGKFNDVIVWSRLPGDCNERGCMVAVFHLVGEKWESVARFQAIGVMQRDPKGERLPDLVAVGDATIPSTVYRWDGKTFKELQ